MCQCAVVQAETTTQDALYQPVAALDTKLFDAVNQCDHGAANK